MLPGYETKTNIGVGVGFLLQIIGRVAIMMPQEQPNPVILLFGLVLSLAGAALFIWGCCNYAMGKGHSWGLGFLGLLSCIGLIILVVLPDKSDQVLKARRVDSDDPDVDS